MKQLCRIICKTWKNINRIPYRTMHWKCLYFFPQSSVQGSWWHWKASQAPTIKTCRYIHTVSVCSLHLHSFPIWTCHAPSGGQGGHVWLLRHCSRRAAGGSRSHVHSRGQRVNNSLFSMSKPWRQIIFVSEARWLRPPRSFSFKSYCIHMCLLKKLNNIPYYVRLQSGAILVEAS